MKPDRNYFATRVQQWAIDDVKAVAAEYQLTYGEALEKSAQIVKSMLSLDQIKDALGAAK